jgi:hypothetical protein
MIDMQESLTNCNRIKGRMKGPVKVNAEPSKDGLERL